MNLPPWTGLESNPLMVTRFARNIGLPEGYAFTDVYGTDPDLLAMVPKPCYALIVLFPTDAEPLNEERRKSKINPPEGTNSSEAKKTFYLKQLDGLGNACGAVAVIHSLANAKKSSFISYDEECFLSKYMSQAEPEEPEERGKLLAANDALREASETAATAPELAQTDAPELDAELLLHFCALVPTPNNHIIELDGRQSGPVDHGPFPEGLFIEHAAQIVQRDFIEKAPGDLRFSLMALTFEYD